MSGYVFAAAVSVVLTLAAARLDARQFRQLQPIATPAAPIAALPDGARAVAEPVPLGREQVEPAVQRVIGSWNTRELEQQLGAGFYDKSRLLDTLDSVAPRDARLRLQSIQGVQTLQQYIEPDPNRAGRERLVSRVSVTARTQVEFTASNGTFTRLPGVNEFILRIIHPEQGP